MGIRFFELGGLFTFLVVAGVLWLFAKSALNSWGKVHDKLRAESKEDASERQ